jgi:predicted Zn-dependent protease
MTRILFPPGGSQYGGDGGRPRGSGSFKIRILIALALVVFALITYFGRPRDENQITGESQRVAFNEEADEVQMGLQAVPEMAAQFGGADPEPEAQAMVKRVGEQLLQALDDSLEPGGRHNPYRDAFRFTLLGDTQTVNAFALPGGQIFITRALFRDLETEGQLAGVLAHEIGHVIERHGNQRMAQQQFFQGLAAAGGVAGGSQQSAQVAQQVAAVAQMSYGREDELESDEWGVRLTTLAGYDPRSMLGVMEVLERASHGPKPPEMLSTHPSNPHRIARIKELIAHEFPNGVPDGLVK